MLVDIIIYLKWVYKALPILRLIKLTDYCEVIILLHELFNLKQCQFVVIWYILQEYYGQNID